MHWLGRLDKLGRRSEPYCVAWVDRMSLITDARVMGYSRT
jgi:hypothetical protein